MPSIRKTKTASGAVAVQIVRYEHRKVIVVKHIGSGRNSKEVDALVESAQIWIEQETKQLSLFPNKQQRTLSVATTNYVGVTHSFTREILLHVARRCGFDRERDAMLLDFAVMRLIEPTSKLRSIELMKRYFGIQYAERSVYRMLPTIKDRKEAMEDIVRRYAVKTLKSDLTVVLYDVTTLYFETFTADELRMPGFSKDNKPQQPQIVVGLLVTRQGFPLGYELFAGNTFEGKTMIPVLESFADKHKVVMPTVVADAAMLSQSNIEELQKRKISYIVGARMANISPVIIEKISRVLDQQDKAVIRLSTRHGDLIASFSIERYRKNKGDMERQIARGQKLIERHEPGRRAKFVMKKGGDSYILNQALIKKTNQLLGIKGYYTDIPVEILSNQDVIARYHDLWHVEQAFRMAKSDLASRPIFHYKQDSVKTHMLICFVALVIGKYIEIQTGISTRTMRDILWSVTDAKMIDTATNESFSFRSPLDDDVKKFLDSLKMSY